MSGSLAADVLHGLDGALGGALAEATTQIEERFRFLHLPPPWIIVLLVVPLVILFVGFFYRREQAPTRETWRWGPALIRVLVILAVLAMLGQPVQRKTIYKTHDSTHLVLVDDSLSMAIADRYADPEIAEKLAEFLSTSTEAVQSLKRYEIVQRLFRDEAIGFLDALRQKGKVVVATFAKTAQERGRLSRKRNGSGEEEPAGSELLPPYEKVQNDPRVHETRLAECLREAVSGVLGSGFGDDRETVSGVILISDFQENSGSASSIEVARRLGERGTPVYAIGIGNPDEPRDIRLVHLDVNEVVLKDDNVPFKVTLVADGFEGERVGVRLKIDSVVVSTEYVELLGGGEEQSVSLDYRPREPGDLNVTVEVDHRGGEVFRDNNSISKTVRVLDERIKLLYVEHLPRWEYRYLKNSLTRDVTMETQVWLFSADPGFEQESSFSVPPLRTFPRSRAELLRYHVIILGDVDPDDLGVETMTILKEFVLEGGGLILIAGRHANPSKYLHTDLYPLIPVEIPERDPLGIKRRRNISEGFKVQLTPVGRKHAIMRLDNDPDQNVYLWEDEAGGLYEGLSPFFRFERVGREKASAVVLARHPRQFTDDKGLTVFAYMNYGRGLTFFSAVDDTWRWRKGVDNLYLGRFWGQVVRFVASGRLLGKTVRFSVTTDKTVYNIGETVKIESRIFDEDMKPSTDKTKTLYHEMEGREGESPETVVLSLNEIKGRGTYEGAFVATRRGRHDVWLGTETDRQAFRSFTVEIPALESRDPKLNRTLMEKIAKVSGGEYYDLSEVMEAVEELQGVSRSQEGLVENDDLWDEWWVVVLFTLLISTEWILRKLLRLQ